MTMQELVRELGRELVRGLGRELVRELGLVLERALVQEEALLATMLERAAETLPDPCIFDAASWATIEGGATMDGASARCGTTAAWARSGVGAPPRTRIGRP